MPCVPSAGSVREEEEILLAFFTCACVHVCMCACPSVCACNCLLHLGLFTVTSMSHHDPSGSYKEVRLLHDHMVTMIPGELGRK